MWCKRSTEPVSLNGRYLEEYLIKSYSSSHSMCFAYLYPNSVAMSASTYSV